MIFKLEKPNEKFHNQADVNGDGTQPTIRLSYDATKTVRLGSDYAIDESILSLRSEKKLTPTLTTSLTGQSFPENGAVPAHEVVLLGLSWND